jgi:transposase
VRDKLKDSNRETGRPSIDPQLLLRILLIGYLYGIISERKLVEELRMHLAWRWLTGLSFDQEIPHHSTFSKNRHGRFEESNVFQQLFEHVVRNLHDANLARKVKKSRFCCSWRGLSTSRNIAGLTKQEFAPTRPAPVPADFAVGCRQNLTICP